LKIGVIGTGYWGGNHVRALTELQKEGKIDEVIVCDTKEGVARQLAKRYNISFVTNPEELKDVSGVTIATPSPTHYALSRTFLESGVHVLVEKPMTINIEEAKKLVSVAKNSSAILLPGHLFRHHPAVIELKQRLDSGELGEIEQILSERSAFRAPRSDMGVNYALNIHEVDLFCHLLNRNYPKRLFCIQHNPRGGHEEISTIHLDFGLTHASCLGSWLTPIRGKIRTLTVIGSERSAFIDYLRPDQLVIHDSRIIKDGESRWSSQDEGSQMIPLPYKEPLKEEMLNFINSCRGTEKPRATPEDGQRAVEMIEGAFRSVIEGNWVQF